LGQAAVNGLERADYATRRAFVIPDRGSTPEKFLLMTFSTRIPFLLASIACISLSAVAQQTLANPPAADRTAPSVAAPPAPTAPQPSAQETSSQPPSPQAPPAQAHADKNAEKGQDDKAQQSTSGEGKVAGTSNDRLFKVLPNFLTLENAKNVPPLTAKQKFKVVALGTFDPVQYPWWGLLASLNQADNSEPGYGQGWGSYGKRYLTTAADSTIENFMVGAVLPSILRQDPRFYELGHGSFAHRTGYAISRIFVTRSDSGPNQFNFSEIGGSALAASISTFSYHPRSTYLSTPTNPRLFIPSDRTLRNAASVWGSQVAIDTATLVVKEFWPDIHRKMAKIKHNAAIAGQPAPANP
jgi:hypothetical protein